MHVRVFEAPTLERAQAAVRAALGDDALILGIEQAAAGLKITAAIEPDTDAGTLLAAPPAAPDPALGSLLSFHGVPRPLRDKISAASAGATLAQGLAHAFGSTMRTSAPGHRHLLVGPAGHGKSLQAARLARRMQAEGMNPRVLVLEGASGADGTGAARWLDGTGIAVNRASDDAALAAAAAEPGALIVDTPGLSPLLPAGSERLRALVDLALDVEASLVASAELPASTALELVADCLALGCRSVLLTKLDLTVRQGGLAALASAGIPLLPASVGNQVATPLASLTPDGLARLLVQRFQASMRKPAAGGRA